MVYEDELTSSLAAIGWEAFEGEVWRQVFAGRPLLAENTDGARWNPPGVGALYASLSSEGAVAEHEHLIAAQNRPPRIPPELHRLEVRFARVLTLTMDEVIKLGLNGHDVDSDLGLAACQHIGGAIEHLNVEAAVVPSLRKAGTQNLVIYVANVDVERGSYFDVADA